jgi:zinc/manganese transport system permease protein
MTGALLAASPTGVGLGSILGHEFMRNAFLAGIPIAALAGVVGYFMVLRSEVFTGDALSHAAFTGALAALATGLDARLGLFVATVAIAVLLGVLGRERADDVVIGTIFAWVLGLGVLALSLYAASPRAATNGAAGVTVLFGSIFGIDAGEARTAAIVGVVLLLLVVALARPLLFASVDVDVAAVRGVPVRALGLVFVVVVGATAAEATQAVGALLLLGLLSAPAGAARRLTDRPYLAMVLSAALAVTSMVVGLTAAYLLPEVPPSFGILAVASGLYAATFLLGPLHREPRGSRVSASPAGA